jgi:hypothetical protein
VVIVSAVAEGVRFVWFRSFFLDQQLEQPRVACLRSLTPNGVI